MANIARVRVLWSGGTVVGGGLSTFFWDEADTGFVAKLGTFYGAIVNRLAAGTLITIPNTGDLLDVATGELSGTWSETATYTVASATAGVYAAGTGARVTWATSGIRNGRRVKGSTFLVPLVGTCYAVDGTIDAAVNTGFQTAAQALVTASAGHMRVYSRPKAGSAGQQNTVIGAAAPDFVSGLRSRRT